MRAQFAESARHGPGQCWRCGPCCRRHSRQLQVACVVPQQRHGRRPAGNRQVTSLSRCPSLLLCGGDSAAHPSRCNCSVGNALPLSRSSCRNCLLVYCSLCVALCAVTPCVLSCAAGASAQGKLHASSSAPACGNLFDRFDQAAHPGHDHQQQQKQQQPLQQHHSQPCLQTRAPGAQQQQPQPAGQPGAAAVVRGRRLTARRGSWGGSDQQQPRCAMLCCVLMYGSSVLCSFILMPVFCESWHTDHACAPGTALVRTPQKALEAALASCKRAMVVTVC